MSNLTTERAVKKAYFTDLEGGHLIEFQFAPAELDFEEGGKFVDRIMTGNYFNDLTWISGKPNDFSLRLFIDRTQESYTVDNYNQDPFSTFRRFPNRNPRFSSFDSVNLIRGIANSNKYNDYASSLENSKDGGKKVAPSNYTASPHFKQTQFNENSGVITDVEALLYYVRPKGLKLAEITIQRDGTVNVTDFEQGRFTPPPKIRFYYGNMWREGYIVEVKYNLSVMNKQLVPRRLDANIKMTCTRWGYLNELDAVSSGSAIDVFDVAPNNNNISNLA